MIDYLDNLLRHLLLKQVAELTDEAQVRFQPPNQEWSDYVKGLAENAVNVYLFDLRENRKLRSNERGRQIENGVIIETPAPHRIDCHYLITAWSPSMVTPAIEPTVDEHALLYSVTSGLLLSQPLVPRDVYDPDPLPASFPEIISEAELPTTILPVEGFPKYAEFWGTMGDVHPWKPAVYLIVTIPVEMPKQVSGPMVTTRITEYRQTGKPETAEVWIQIGGHVLDATGPQPIPIAGAWVQLETATGEPLQTTETNALGRYTFNKLRPGPYRLSWRAGAFPEPAPRLIDVPSPSGEYDLKFV
jgi:Pvc16 N-terminal domain/Carboxypeptidase regulatory-like domain